jgi:2'-5' RNA ligase
VQARLREVRASAFQIHVGGVGFFPNAQAPRVFWAGIQGGIQGAPNAHELATLAHSVNQSLEALGFPPEREFHPHLTLARNGSGRPGRSRRERPPGIFAQLAAIVASSPAPEFGTMTAREFFLYESKLSPTGASYHKLEAFPLA